MLVQLELVFHIPAAGRLPCTPVQTRVAPEQQDAQPGSATAATVRTIRWRATPDLLSGEIRTDLTLPLKANERRRRQRSSSASHARRVVKGANTFTAAHRHAQAAVPRFQQSSNKEHTFPLPDRDSNASCLNETLADASLPSAKLSRVTDATGDCMDARLGTKQALASTQELNTWTVAAHAQAEENNHHKTPITFAQPEKNRLSTNPGTAQALTPPHSSTRSQEESSGPATSTSPLSCQHLEWPTHADSRLQHTLPRTLLRHSDLKDSSSQCAGLLLPRCWRLDPSHVQRWRSPLLHLSCCHRLFRVCGHALAELSKPLVTARPVVTGPTRHLHRGLRCRGGLHGRAVTAQTEAASIPLETSAATFLPGAAPLVDTAGATLLRQRRPAISPQQTQHIGTGTNVASPRGHKQRRTHPRTRAGTDSKMRTPSITTRK